MPAAATVVLVGVLLSLAITWVLARSRLATWVRDVPNDRSLHSEPMPRTGGLAVFAAVLAALYFVAPDLVSKPAFPWFDVALGAAIIAAVSFMDDLRGVGAPGRLAAHVLAAVLAVRGGLTLGAFEVPGFTLRLPPVVGGLAAVLFIVWMVNLYNFMDGMDGFAGGMTTVGFGTVAYLSIQGGDPANGLLAVGVAAAALGFLAFNFPPASIFLGDVGSAPLGFLAAATLLRAEGVGSLPLWAGVVVFAPFVVDASVTLLRRALRGDAVWQAHHSHAYQRLVRSGWSHRRTVLAEYSLMILSAVAAGVLVGVPTPGQVGLLAVVTFSYAALLVAVERKCGFP